MDPSEFNIFVQNKFQNWQDHAYEYFAKSITEDLENPASQHYRANDDTFFFARSGQHSATDRVIYEREINIENTNLLSTKVIPQEGAASSKDGVYFRLQSYKIVLVNAKDGSNLTCMYFNFHEQLEKLMQMQKKNLDLCQLIAMEVKVFYNTAVDFWRMHIDVDQIYKKYIN